MNCEQLHSALAAKDQEIKERKENTIEAFNKVKDWALDYLIKDAINSEFKGDVYIPEYKIYPEVLKSFEISTKGLKIEHYSLSCDAYPMIYSISSWVFVDAPDREEVVSNAQKNLKDVNKFIDKFDHSLFWELLNKHILSNGFKTQTRETLRGKIVNVDYHYTTTRRALENACCPPVEVQEVFDESNDATVAWVSFVVIILILAIVFIFG